MLLFLSFLILQYVAERINSKKRIHQIESDFENFKLAATKDEFILNAVYPEETMDKLLHATNISEFIEISEKNRIPIQHLLYEWNYAPAQDSPKHILNALNDDCIQEILRHLTDIGDL